jgi:hypothetical protein
VNDFFAKGVKVEHRVGIRDHEGRDRREPGETDPNHRGAPLALSGESILHPAGGEQRKDHYRRGVLRRSGEAQTGAREKVVKHPPAT